MANYEYIEELERQIADLQRGMIQAVVIGEWIEYELETAKQVCKAAEELLRELDMQWPREKINAAKKKLETALAIWQEIKSVSSSAATIGTTRTGDAIGNCQGCQCHHNC